MLRFASLGLVLALAGFSGSARADEESDKEERKRIETWLESEPAHADLGATSAPEAPPPPPRKHGFVVESSVGAMGHIGSMSHITPAMPWFRTAFGWEPTKWVMLLAQGDIAAASTSLANPPPDPRGYALWGLSGAVRFGVQPTSFLGISAQGEIGAARVTEDVLSTYGYKDANKVGPYFGALVGVEWYQVSPHVALVLQGGIRSYASIFDRTALPGGAALAWISAGALKYTF
ncbi:MAG TPA: hypothetical protein VHE30_20380 [Polyangiaceae bacterium]|nr:hypothetical protein [Polyangiaceae bacterium]